MKKTLIIIIFVLLFGVSYMFLSGGKILESDLSSRERAYFELGFKAGMEDINFYGKVVDQYGKSVVGAIVPFCTGGALLASGKGCGQTKTDAEGNFEIHSEGGSLTLKRVSHPDITFSFPKPNYGGLQRAVTTEMTFRGYHQSTAKKNYLWTDTSAEKPYMFTAWRVEEYENVISGRDISHQFADGRVYTFKLDKRNYRDRREEGITDGHLRISCTRQSIESVQDHTNWQIILEPVEGGIQTTKDYNLNLAPEGGYQPTLVIDMRKGTPGYQRSLSNQRYFFTAKNGEVYGSLYMHFEPHAKKDMCILTIDQYKVNLNASRNLAVRPK